VKVVIYGTGENAYQAMSILRHRPEYDVVGFLDDDKAKHGTTYQERPVFGGMDAVPGLCRDEDVAGGLVAIGNNAVRGRLTKQLKAHGLTIIQAIHPQTFIDAPHHIGEGVIIEMGAAVHVGATVGDGVFVGGGAIISHHSTVGDFALLGGAVVFGGNIRVGAYSLIGVGGALQPQITIGKNVVVGVGAAVVSDLPDNAVAVGVPAKVIRQNPPLADI